MVVVADQEGVWGAAEGRMILPVTYGGQHGEGALRWAGLQVAVQEVPQYHCQSWILIGCQTLLRC